MITVKCPTCDASVAWTPESRFRPFCSERCKQIDLGAWASERYTISSDAQDPTQESESGIDAAPRADDDDRRRIN